MPKEDRRRGLRLSRAVPLALSQNGKVTHANTSVISALGALVMSAEPFYPGANVTVTNQRTGMTLETWVVSSRPADAPETFAVALEFLQPTAKFWGADYEHARE